MYRVWTINCNGTVSCITDWMSYTQCRKTIIGKWGHWPPFAYISRAKNANSFCKYNHVERW